MRAATNDKVHITYFTDPLCCWSWAMEPQIRKFRFQFQEYIDWEFKLGGLIPSWDQFHDETNTVSRPAQMGPVWLHAQQISGMRMASRLWATDPPASSYPACIAVKCAMTQSPSTGEVYLRVLREACMLHGENIAKREVLIKHATALANLDPCFDLDLFVRDFSDINGQRLFKIDWLEAKERDINRFPTLLMRYNNETIQMSGFKSYNTLLKAITTLRPDLTNVEVEDNLTQYSMYWNGLQEAERRVFISDSN